MSAEDAARAKVRAELRAGMYRDIGVMREYAERALEVAQVRLRAIACVAEELKRKETRT